MNQVKSFMFFLKNILSSILNALFGAVEVPQEAKSTTVLSGRLAKHFVAGAAAIALSTSGAEAQVVWNNVNIAIPATIDGLYVNVETGATTTLPGNNLPGWDINPYGTSTTAISLFWSTGSNGLSQGVKLNTVAGGAGSFVGSLPYGYTIGPSLVGGSYGTGGTNFTTTDPGKWLYNADNYFGFKFTAADGLIHYGYGKIQVGANAASRFLTGFGYQVTPGAPINVGDGDPIPTPCVSPTLSASTVSPTCQGVSNGSINLSTSGGLPTPFTYLWSNGETTEDLSNLAPGTYTVTVTTASGGCTATGSYTVAPSSNAPTTNTSSVTACASYTWSVNNNTYTQSGTYTHVNGCITEVLNLTINPAPPQPPTACYQTAVWDPSICNWRLIITFNH